MINRISQEIVEGLELQLYDIFHDSIIERGFEYFKKGRVQDVNMASSHVVKAKVQGSGPRAYDVEVDVDHLGFSRCSCPYNGYCKHMAAVIVSITQQKETEELVLPTEADHPEAWVAYFERATNQLNHSVDIGHEYNVFYYRSLRDFHSHSEVLKDIFHAYLLFFLLRSLEKAKDFKFRYAFHMYHYAELQDTFVKSLMELFQHDGVHEYYQIYPEHVRVMTDVLHRQLDDPDSRIGFLVYRIFLLGWLIDPKWLTSEKQYFISKLQAFNDSEEWGASRIKDTFLNVLVNVEIVLGDDVAAYHAYKQIRRVEDNLITLYLRQFEKEENWPRLAWWLARVQTHLKNQAKDEMIRVLYIWKQAAGHLPGGEQEWETVVESMMPFTREIYFEYLLEKKRAREWVERWVDRGNTVDYVSAQEIKAIEAIDPEALLPVYHHSIELQLEEKKNRQSYRLVVKYLKKLRTLYKKSKKPEMFEQFIAGLMEKNKRLRAFQEEVRRGKLWT